MRVHTGGEAVQMNQELGAQAFTHGSDVYFGEGKSPGNNELTAHELTSELQTFWLKLIWAEAARRYNNDTRTQDRISIDYFNSQVPRKLAFKRN
jgi:hypothetical protein